MPAIITRASVFEDSGAVVMARVRGSDGSYVQQADLSKIERTISTPGNVGTATNIDITASVFDTLQTSDPRWTVDTTGYNFRDTVSATDLPLANVTYRVEYKFTPTSGQPFWVVYELTTLDLLAV